MRYTKLSALTKRISPLASSIWSRLMSELPVDIFVHHPYQQSVFVIEIYQSEEYTNQKNIIIIINHLYST